MNEEAIITHHSLNLTNGHRDEHASDLTGAKTNHSDMGFVKDLTNLLPELVVTVEKHVRNFHASCIVARFSLPFCHLQALVFHNLDGVAHVMSKHAGTVERIEESTGW